MKANKTHSPVKIVSMILVLCTVLSLCTATVFAATPTDGLAFEPQSEYGEVYKLSRGLAAMPVTFEATVYFPSSYTDRGGVIVGNYKGSGVECFNFEIYSGGQPRLYIIDGNNTLNITFDGVNVCKGSWVHVAITWSASTKTAICYVNGEAKQTKTASVSVSVKNNLNVVLGGDNRDGNAQNFKGLLRDLSLYSDVRTAAEVKSDYQNTTVDTSSLIGHWNMPSTATAGATIADVSSNKNDFVKKVNTDFISKAPATGYAYSFAVVGDIQKLNYLYPEKLHLIYDWIVDNAEEKNTQFVFQLGDITDTDAAREWARAKSVMSKMDGVVPYSVVRGNHDGATNFKKYFPLEEYKHMIAGSYDNTMLNTFQKITVGKIKYLILNLDIGTEQAVLDWAGEVIEAHPDYNVIITTHIYLRSNGYLFSNAESAKPTKYNPNGMNSDEFWDKFVSKYENIKLVISGHDPSDDIVHTKKVGVNGNEVQQILVDPQSTDKDTTGGVGLVAMLYFSEDGKNVEVEYYSTVREKFFKQSNQFTLQLEVIESDDPDQGGDEGNQQTPDQGGNANTDQNAGNNNTGNTDNTPNVQEPVSGLVIPKGAAVGIVAGVVVVFGALGYVVFAFIFKKKKKKDADAVGE